MNGKHILLLVFVVVCFLLVTVTVLDAIQEANQISGQDQAGMYLVNSNATPIPTLEPSPPPTVDPNRPSPTPGVVQGIEDDD